MVTSTASAALVLTRDGQVTYIFRQCSVDGWLLLRDGSALLEGGARSRNDDGRAIAGCADRTAADVLVEAEVCTGPAGDPRQRGVLWRPLGAGPLAGCRARQELQR